MITIIMENFIFKNKIYTKLESVELFKMEGYEEAKKVVDESYGDK